MYSEIEENQKQANSTHLSKKTPAKNVYVKQAQIFNLQTMLTSVSILQVFKNIVTTSKIGFHLHKIVKMR